VAGRDRPPASQGRPSALSTRELQCDKASPARAGGVFLHTEYDGWQRSGHGLNRTTSAVEAARLLSGRIDKYHRARLAKPASSHTGGVRNLPTGVLEGVSEVFVESREYFPRLFNDGS
jgi:hypothetical protein